MLALQEILALSVRHLADLPIPTTLVVRTDGNPKPVWFTTSREVAADAAKAGVCALTPLEYEALAIGLADGLLSPAGARAEFERKLRETGYRVDRRRIFGAVRHPDRRAMGGRYGLTFVELFAVLGMELVEVRIVTKASAESEAA